MEEYDKHMREDIGILKCDIMDTNKEEIFRAIDKIKDIEARIYYREVFNIACKELDEELEDMEQQEEEDNNMDEMLRDIFKKDEDST